MPKAISLRGKSLRNSRIKPGGSCAWPTANSLLSADWLTRELVNVFGGNIVGLWAQDDLVIDGTNAVIAWPARIGVALTTSIGAGLVGAWENGRRAAMAPNTSTYRSIGIASVGTAYKSVIAISQSLAPFGPSSYRHLVQGFIQDSGAESITGMAASNNLYVGTGWTHYVDGIATENALQPDTNVHIWEGDKASNVIADISVGGATGVYGTIRNWCAPIGTILALSVIPNSAQRAAYVAIFNRYIGSIL